MCGCTGSILGGFQDLMGQSLEHSALTSQMIQLGARAKRLSWRPPEAIPTKPPSQRHAGAAISADPRI